MGWMFAATIGFRQSRLAWPRSMPRHVIAAIQARTVPRQRKPLPKSAVQENRLQPELIRQGVTVKSR
jgi:hypothetical protein